MYKHPSVSIRPRRHAIRYSRFFIIHFGIASPPASLFPRIRPFPTRKSTMAVLARETNKLPRSQAVAVFYFENHSVLNVRLITGSLLSSTPACRQAGGKLRFPRPPFLMRIHPSSQAVGEFCAWINIPQGADFFKKDILPYTAQMSLQNTKGFWPVTAAIGGNFFVTLIKLFAAVTSGSSSMLSEAV